MCRISRDADNREKAAPYPEFLSQRILSWPVALRRGLIHDEYPRGLFIVIRCKLASFQNGYMEGLEIPRGHLGMRHLQRFMRAWCIPFRIHILPLLGQAHRNPVRKRRNFHAGQCRHAIKNLVTDQLFLVVAVAGNIQPHGAVRIWSCSKPGFAPARFRSVRRSSPEHNSRGSESAICATTSPLSNFRLREPPEILADSAFSTSIAGALNERQAGSAPHSIPANRENPAIPITTLWSMFPFSTRGIAFAGKNHANVFDVHDVNPRATTPATMESTAPSSIICRTSCMRLAPSDCRIASSRRRDTNRTSVSVATFALVSNSTKPAKASRMGSVAAIYPLAPNGERHMGSSVIRLSPRYWSGYAVTNN